MAKTSKSADVVNKLYNQIPAFTEIFDEETFYIFAVCVTIGTIFLVFIVSRYVTIKAIN